MSSEISRPMPRAAPVTTATLSLSIMAESLLGYSNDAFRGERVDLRGREAALREHVAAVLAQPRRRGADGARGLLELHRRRYRLEFARARVVLLGDQAGRHHLGVRRNHGIVVARRAEDVGLLD